MLGAGRLNAGYAVKTALSYYLSSQNSGTFVNPDKETIEVEYEEIVNGDNETVSVETIDIENAYTYVLNNDCEVYDVSGKVVNLETSKQGIYFIVKEGILLSKVWKQWYPKKIL